MSRHHRPPPAPSLPSFTQLRLATVLAPQLTQFADDAWLLAQRHPALVADPALLGAAERLRALQLRVFRPDAARRLLPDRFLPGLTLHGLALSLRQMETALAALIARHAPPREPDSAAAIDDIAQLQALILRGITLEVAERNGVELPERLRPATPPPPPPREPGRPPQPNPLVHRVRSQNSRRRMRVIVGKPEIPKPNPGPAEKLIPARIRSL